MATQTKSKEEKELERKRKQREKELKILKAQNEMLEEAKQTVLARDNWGENDDPDGVIAEIEAAQEDNLKMAMSYHKANADEVQSMTYNKVSKKGIEDYNRRLEARNLTDEMLHQKELATVSTAATTSTTTNKRIRRNRVRNEEISVVEKPRTVIKEETVEKVFVSKPVNKQMYETNEWDLSSVPEYVQFDMIPLPSKGQCYPIDSPLRSGFIPVSYLTASDENLIHSPNMYRDGKIVDVIISRKIVDKRVKASDLCKGDRDAIAIWLRATGYGDSFPIVVRNPHDNEKMYNTTIKLSELKYNEFNLEGDENGLFTYISKKGDVFKFKQTTKEDEEHLKKIVAESFTTDTKLKIYNAISDVNFYFNQIEDIDVEERNEIKMDIDEIMEWSNNLDDDVNDEEDVFFNAITESMILKTVSINNQTSEEYIRHFIDNMMAQDAYEYRLYMEANVPSVDFKLIINIPESDGGGSFETFLRIDHFIFRNV